jgi:hypothetical protein
MICVLREVVRTKIRSINHYRFYKLLQVSIHTRDVVIAEAKWGGTRRLGAQVRIMSSRIYIQYK